VPGCKEATKIEGLKAELIKIMLYTNNKEEFCCWAETVKLSHYKICKKRSILK
jgi:hypothetical protein